MHCIIATEGPERPDAPDPGNLIIANLRKIPEYSQWYFEVCHHGKELLSLQSTPDVIVVSRFLAGESMETILKHLPTIYPSSRIVLLAGKLNETTKAFIKMAHSKGLTNIVTGRLPGDRPYTLPVALLQDKETDIPEVPEIPCDNNGLPQTMNVNGIDVVENSAHAEQIKYEQAIARDSSDLNKIVASIVENRPQVPSKKIRVKKAFKFAAADEEINQNSFIAPQNMSQTMPKRLDFTNRYQKGILCLTTSNKGGVGKTTVAITLAEALARAGVSTCIVDFDFGAPDLASFFKISKGRGIEYLVGKVPKPGYVDEIIRKVKDNLYVLPGPMNAAFPQFEPGQLKYLVNVLLAKYSVVIGDTSPEFWTKTWYFEVFETANLVFSVVDQSIFSEQETVTYVPRLIGMGVTPEKIRIVLNKFSPKLHNAKIVEKHFCSGLKKNVPAKILPRVAATIPEDWDAHAIGGYKSQAVGLDDTYSQWHKLAAEVAQMAGFNYDLAPGKKKEDLIKKLFGKFKK